MAAVRVRNRCPRSVIVRHGGRVLRSQISRPPAPADGDGTQYPCHRFTLTRRTIYQIDCADGTTTTTVTNPDDVSPRVPAIKWRKRMWSSTGSSYISITRLSFYCNTRRNLILNRTMIWQISTAGWRMHRRSGKKPKHWKTSLVILLFNT